LIAIATALGSMTSPSATTPSGRPACPIRSSPTWPRRPTPRPRVPRWCRCRVRRPFGPRCSSPLLCLGSGARRPGDEASAVKVIDSPKCDLEQLAVAGS
jgi:hypothetical protein